MPHHPKPTRLALAATAAMAALALCPTLSQAYCDDVEGTREGFAATQALSRPDPARVEAGKRELRELVDTAVRVSAETRAAEHTRLAAGYDLDQTKASAKPQISLQTMVGGGKYVTRGVDFGIGGQGNTGLTMTGPIYDGGRNAAQVGFREQLLAASGSALSAKQEQVAHESLLAVLERIRLRYQLQIHEQHIAKLSCLTGLVDRVVQADKGRASELVQARTGLYQAEVARDELRTAVRQSDAKIRRLLGDSPADWRDIAFAVREPPPLAQALQAVMDNPEVRQLQQQADAQVRLAESVAAEASPQVKFQMGYNAVRPADYVNYKSWSAGLTLNYTLFDSGINQAARGAARERALAARQSVDQMVADRTKDVNISFDAANGAFRRAARLVDVIRDSNKVRNATYTQWAQLGSRSLFDLISAENEHKQLGLLHASTLFDGLVAASQVRTAGGGMLPWVAPDLVPAPVLGALSRYQSRPATPLPVTTAAAPASSPTSASAANVAPTQEAPTQTPTQAPVQAATSAPPQGEPAPAAAAAATAATAATAPTAPTASVAPAAPVAQASALQAGAAGVELRGVQLGTGLNSDQP